MARSITVAAGILLMSAGAAVAQDANQPVLGATGLRQSLVRIQDQVSFFVPGPVGDSDEAVKVRERARRSIYDMAAHECDVLRETIARDCRLESVNANVTANNRQFPQLAVQVPEGWQVNGTMSFQVTIK
jgi:hypothetical protein